MDDNQLIAAERERTLWLALIRWGCATLAFAITAGSVCTVIDEPTWRECKGYRQEAYADGMKAGVKACKCGE
jgi:hypothetical protein